MSFFMISSVSAHCGSCGAGGHDKKEKAHEHKACDKHKAGETCDCHKGDKGDKGDAHKACDGSCDCAKDKEHKHKEGESCDGHKHDKKVEKAEEKSDDKK